MTTSNQRLRVLVFDRDLHWVTILQRHLSWQGFEVFSVSDRRSAERLLGRMPISLLLTGLEPDADRRRESLEFLHHARRHHPSLRTVLLTGAPSSSLVFDTATSGVDAHLSKPIDLEQLRLTILGLLETD